MTKILTLKEARDKGLNTRSYYNGDYEYKDKDGTVHYIKGDK